MRHNVLYTRSVLAECWSKAPTAPHFILKKIGGHIFGAHCPMQISKQTQALPTLVQVNSKRKHAAHLYLVQDDKGNDESSHKLQW